MKVNKWTVRLAAAGLVSLPCLMQAEEKASPIMTAVSSTTISGYVDTSAHWNPGTGNANPAPYLYNAGKADGFNLDKVKVRLDKPLSEEKWGAGYRVDLLFGPDANVFNTSSSIADVQDFAIQQAYVALRAPVYNDLIFKMGVFDSIIGYESHDSVNDPNYTRSYATSLEPHTHTGLLATYQVVNWLGVAAGIADTMGPSINARANPPKAESYKTYMGSLEVTALEEWGWLGGSKLYAGIVSGFSGGPDNGSTQNYYVGATVRTPVKGLRVGASFDYVNDLNIAGNDINGTSGAVADAASSWALYASFQPEDSKWGFHLRGEYGDAFPLFGAPDALVPVEADVFALTGTISYDLWKNVLTRLEVRWDHSTSGINGDGHLFGGETAGSPTLKNEWLIAANVIYKF